MQVRVYSRAGGLGHRQCVLAVFRGGGAGRGGSSTLVYQPPYYYLTVRARAARRFAGTARQAIPYRAARHNAQIKRNKEVFLYAT